MAKRPTRATTISRHPERLSIELARIRGCSLDVVADKFGVGRDSVARHMAGLDPDYRAALTADIPIAELAERAGREGLLVLDNLGVLAMSVSRAALAAEAAGQPYAHASLSRVWLEVTRERAKITGELVTAPSISNVVNNYAILMNSPLLHRLQMMLATRLAPFPDAYAAVLDGLADLEGAPAPMVLNAA